MKVKLVRDNFKEEVEVHEIKPSELGQFLKINCDPTCTRILHNNLDITPVNKRGIKRVLKLDEITVLTHPTDPFTLGIIALGVAVASVALSFILRPSAPTIDPVENRPQRSPNNTLSERQNTARLGQRIPDIYGTVRAYPDLIALPYRKFINNIEYEFSFMCLGRGEFAISSADIKDAETPVENITGSQVEVYGPNTSPNSGSPQLTIGSAISETLVKTTRIQAVNGQTLLAPNENAINGTDLITFHDNGSFVRTGSTDFTASLSPGDIIDITGAEWYPADHQTLNFNGTYTVDTVTASTVFVTAPNFAWSDRLTSHGGTSDPLSGVQITTGGDSKWEGSIYIGDPGSTGFIANFIAPQGLYKDDGTTRTSLDVDLEIEVTPVDENFGPIDSPTYYNTTLDGDASGETGPAQIGVTLVGTFPDSYVGRARVRARRLTNTILSGTSTVVDNVKWRDLYSTENVTETDFGDVTTIYSVVKNTTEATSIKSRKLSINASRIIPTYDSSGVYIQDSATSYAPHIYIAAALDNRIGRLSTGDINFSEIFSEALAVKTQFGTLDALDFNWTFDNDQTSFEEMAESIGTAMFSFPVRSGDKISMISELPTSSSLYLFNHRNTIPKSSKRIITFGPLNDFDGVEVEYTDPLDGARLNVTVGTNSVNPKKLKSIGISNLNQATWLAWRLYQKILYQYETIDFTATDEGNLLRRSNRIAVADNTRGLTYSGEIVSAVGGVLTLSNKVPSGVDTSWVILVQLIDGTVSINSVLSVGDYVVNITENISSQISVDENAYARATYTLIEETKQDYTLPFIVVEAIPNNDQSVKVQAINYDERYYTYDGVE